MTHLSDEMFVTATIEVFDTLGIIPHTLPNAIGLWPNEQECLVWTAIQCDYKKPWVEVGSFCGGSTILLGLSNKVGPIFAIDCNFNPMFDLNVRRGDIKNITKLEDLSTAVLSDWSDPIGFLFLDGYHSFRNVVTEFQLTLPHLTDDAIIAFHDCSPKMWTNSHQTHIRNRYEYAVNNFEQLMSTQEQDFYIDEAIAYICTQYDYSIIEIPVRDDVTYFKETRLNEWVRGQTSPYNAFTAIRKKQ